MNILFFQDTIGVGGGEIWVADVAVRLQEMGHNTSIGCPSGSWMEHQAEAREIPYFDYLIDEEFEGSLRWQLAEHLREHQIDIICCGIPGTREEAPILDEAIREVGRGSILLRLGVSPGPGALSPERMGLELDTVGGIFVVSEEIRTRLLNEFPTLSPDSVHVLYNGVDLQKFDPARFSSADRKQLRRSLGIPEDHRVIASVGRLDRIKNLPMLIESAKNVLASHPETTFLIVGEGSEKQALLQAADDAGVRDNFCFAGFVEDIPRLMYTTDILVHASLSEGLPNAVLEAMAMGKPVVASDVGGIPELIQHGHTGLLIPPRGSEDLTTVLCGLLETPQEMERIGYNARTQVEELFDRNDKIHRFENVLVNENTRAQSVNVPPLRRQPALFEMTTEFFQRSCTYQKLPT